jgi:K+-sensing histidine kinase KdpD
MEDDHHHTSCRKSLEKEQDNRKNYAADYIDSVVMATIVEAVEVESDQVVDRERHIIVFLLGMFPLDVVCHLVLRPYSACLGRLREQERRLVLVTRPA